MKEIKKFYGQYKLYILLAVGAWIAWKLRGLFNVFSTVGETISTAAAGATAKITANAQDRVDQVKVRNTSPNGVSPQLLDMYRNDSRTIAASFGNLPGIFTNSVISDLDGAMAVCKRYSKVLYTVKNGTPVASIDPKTKKKALRKDAFTLTALIPFYRELTGGRDLLADCNTEFCMGRFSAYQAFYNSFIKP